MWPKSEVMCPRCGMCLYHIVDIRWREILFGQNKCFQQLVVVELRGL